METVTFVKRRFRKKERKSITPSVQGVTMNETPQGSNKTVWTGDRIREFRKRIGETQAEFAKRFRSTQFMVRWWEQGKGKPGGAAEVILDQLEGSLENNRYRVPELKPPPVTVGV